MRHTEQDTPDNTLTIPICSQELLDTLFERQLLDRRTFGMWLRDSLRDLSFAQLPFVLDQLGRSSSLVYEDLVIGTCIVAAAVDKLQEVGLRFLYWKEVAESSCRLFNIEGALPCKPLSGGLSSRSRYVVDHVS